MKKKAFLFGLIVAGATTGLVSCKKETQINKQGLPLSITLITMNDWVMDSMVFHFKRIDTSVVKNTDSSIRYPRDTSAIHFKTAKLHIATDSMAQHLSFWFLDTANTALTAPPTTAFSNGDTSIYQYVKAGTWGMGNYLLADTFAFVNNTDTSFIRKWKIEGLSTSFLKLSSVDSSLTNPMGAAIYRKKIFYFSHP